MYMYMLRMVQAMFKSLCSLPSMKLAFGIV